MSEYRLNSRFPELQSPPGPEDVGRRMWQDGKEYIAVYNETGAARERGDVATLAYSNDYGTEAIAVATTTFPVCTVVFLDAVPANGLAWVQIAGECAEAKVDGTTNVAAGDFLEVINGGTAFIKDGTARTTVSAAVACEAVTADAATLAKVVLIPEQHTIAAS